MTSVQSYLCIISNGALKSSHYVISVYNEHPEQLFENFKLTYGNTIKGCT